MKYKCHVGSDSGRSSSNDRNVNGDDEDEICVDSQSAYLVG